ncbi:MAG: helix-turn-helix transcriptional regulator [Prolixibacteraceae bacterium]
MKQPELGRKISELRKAKGWTQEELVERCNISVRTIQRIETGEVMPRVYTVKTILAALDYDLNKISDDQDILDSFMNWWKRLLLVDIDIDKPSEYVIRQLNGAWLFGVLYFILGFLEGAAEYFRYQDNELIYGSTFYVIMKLAVLISSVYFQRGFILLGGLFRNYLLKIVSVISIGCSILLIAYDIASIFYDSAERHFILGAAALTFGGIGIIYGLSLKRLEYSIGTIVKYAAFFEILAGCFFLTIVLSFISFILLIPAGLFEIIILYKAVIIIKEKQEEHALA